MPIDSIAPEPLDVAFSMFRLVLDRSSRVLYPLLFLLLSQKNQPNNLFAMMEFIVILHLKLDANTVGLIRLG